jgi:HD-GYP domain-containing protein (c-di-GMP phosphodiesterase class II)
VIFVCDAFHAMTTDRPYRKAMSVGDACKELEAGAGTQFDPDVVAAFLKLAPAALESHPL